MPISIVTIPTPYQTPQPMDASSRAAVVEDVRFNEMAWGKVRCRPNLSRRYDFNEIKNTKFPN